jgi:cytochrome bd-type quinol oxidase subunit 2
MQSLIGFFFGIVGSILFFMTFFTNHDYTYHNSNILYINPLLLAAVPLGILLASSKNSRRWRRARMLLRCLWTYVFFGGILTMAIKALPGFYQQNQVTQALVLPFTLVLSLVPDWITGLHRNFLEKRRG